MNNKWVKYSLMVLAHVASLLLIIVALAFAMSLGLQVSTVYGNIGLVVVGLLVVAYIYFGWVRRFRVKPRETGPH